MVKTSTKKKSPIKAKNPKPKFKRRGTPTGGSKERKALDALFKTYNRPKDNGDDDS